MLALWQWSRKPVTYCYTCLFCLICFFTSHQQSFSYIGTGLPALNQYLARINVLAQGHNAVAPVWLEPSNPRSRIKQSTTEPLRSLCDISSLQCYSVLSDILVNNELCILLERGSNVLSTGKGFICLKLPVSLRSLCFSVLSTKGQFRSVL